ncbi:hypothetical protein V6N11_048425 [Hibiscus sabdariffa]|uniref:Uncharacterized protein n=1 Tax=Hibiscus sabdariffa TaxID=183260 RepID=A0ABR2PVT4_9ROSI
MQSFLRDADSRQGENGRIRLWVSEIRELAYDAEDVVEYFALRIGWRRRVGFSNTIKRSAFILNEGWELCKTKWKIQRIMTRITDLTRQLQMYGVKELRDGVETSVSCQTRRELRRSYPHIVEDNIIGLRDEIEQLVSVLVNEQTPNHKLVSICGMGGLGKTTLAKKEEDSWKLFRKTVFPDPSGNYTDQKVDTKMEELGKDMVKRCAGLPLAIVVLGGILSTKCSLNEWQMVLENVKPYLNRGKGLRIEDVLALSYDDLTSYLRPCFLYLSHFPEDYEVHADRLIQLWVAEGIVSSKQGEDGGETMEDVAEGYLIELAERCMIQVRERDAATSKIKTFQMHDLMRDLCLSKPKQENFVCIVDQSNACSLSMIQKVPRVSTHDSFQIQRISSPNLRSLSFFNEFHPKEGSCRLEFEVAIVSRQLKVPANLGFKSCLVSSGTECYMEQLVHLYLPRECRVETKLKLGTLRNLQTLVNFNTQSCYLGDLISMKNIRVLEVHGPFEIEDFNREDLDKNPPIIHGKYLHSLSIWSAERIDPMHLAHLLSSCVSICKLSLNAEIGRLPERRYLSPNLAYVQLRRCKLEEDPMATLEKLPNLRTLEVENKAFIGKEMLCSAQGFPQLYSLSFWGLYSLEVLKVDDEAMTSLRRLQIESYQKLKMQLPDRLKMLL